MSSLLRPQSNMTVDMDNFTAIRFNGETEYNSNRIYGLHDGQYMIFNIPDNHPIAFINKGRDEYLEYTGVDVNRKTRIGPDGNIYNFYYNIIYMSMAILETCQYMTTIMVMLVVSICSNIQTYAILIQHGFQIQKTCKHNNQHTCQVWKTS